jgi:hypothetical protein
LVPLAGPSLLSFFYAGPFITRHVPLLFFSLTLASPPVQRGPGYPPRLQEGAVLALAHPTERAEQHPLAQQANKHKTPKTATPPQAKQRTKHQANMEPCQMMANRRDLKYTSYTFASPGGLREREQDRRWLHLWNGPVAGYPPGRGGGSQLIS